MPLSSEGIARSSRRALHLGVVALHRVEVEILDIRAGAHRRSRAAAHADGEPRAAQLNEKASWRNRLLVGVLGAHVAQAPRQHDRLVITPVVELEGPEVAAEI